ncbi:MAG TPA: diacylglycerol kinase family protein [Gaiellales bacterium]|nr:diacylglycerol kinase family protein [Gaiellales bacterium]
MVNPAAQNGTAGRRWPGLEERAGQLGLDLDVVFTERPGHATELARQAAADGRALVAALGGDGTVNEVVNGLAPAGAAGPELAILPFGTGRDTIRTYGIPKQAGRALELLRGGRARTIDLGRATFRTGSGEGSRWYINIGSCGLTGAVAERAERTTKRLGGTPSFLFATVATFAAWRNVPFRVQVDDEPVIELVANNVICANGRAFGGGIRVCPQAEPDDGLLDVLVWGDVGKLDLALNLPRLYRGTHLGHRKVTVLRARRVHVEPERPLPLELDGELPGTTPATFEIAPQALRLRVP